MQKVLTFTFDKKKYVSKPFDFEAFCLINENHLSGKYSGKARCCSEAVEYMFEGTDATSDIIKAAGTSIKNSMCNKLWEFYNEVLEESSKNA